MAIYENNGTVTDKNLTALSPEEKLAQAREFAEGSKELEEILLTLWDNGIQTIGCCSGHEGKGFPNITFYANNIDDKILRKILVGLYTQPDYLTISASAGQVSNVKPRDLNIAFSLNKGSDLSGVLKALKDVFSKEVSPETFKEQYHNLPQEKRDFIEAAISMKSLGKMEDMSVPGMREIYPHLPDNVDWKACVIEDMRGSIKYGAGFRFKKTKANEQSANAAFEEMGMSERWRDSFKNRLNSHSYTKEGGKCYSIDAKTGNVYSLPEEEFKAKGYVEDKDFGWHMYDSLPKDKAFIDKLKGSAITKDIKNEQNKEDVYGFGQ